MEKFNMRHSFLRLISVRAVVIIIFFLLSSMRVHAQHFKEINRSNGEHMRLGNQKDSFYSVLTKDGRIQSAQQENPLEVVRLIVTLTGQSLAEYQVNKILLQKVSITSVYKSLQTNHTYFRTALNTVSQQLSIQSKANYNYTIRHDYYRSLNGVALECKRGMISRILSLPMVKQVSPDREVKANLTESVHQIRADIVRDSLGFTGDGVLVGEVDTGIDYNNPALGGGFGPAYRVIGGYDFANNDNDPIDDLGHGTHVAGIIGANDGNALIGVAPDVKFLAVKVLNENGSGWISDVLAGIEYCLDPDGNPDTDDAVDVINMSLGGAPITDDPLENAVNNATGAGVLSVIAAGNLGYGRYGTIQSPGISETALTVGACDSVDHIAFFSAMGPDPIHSSIKPEVVAPGVNILSTVLDNQIESYSGTSMATPHVAGVAALLKQQHPLWTPGEIKAAIINSAHFLGDEVSVFARGKGRVDALDAANARMVVQPGIVNFGYVDLAQDVWRDTVLLTIRNYHSVSQNTQISIIEGLPTGATLTFDKTTFLLVPGEETTIKAVLEVPSSVSLLYEEPFAYLGKIKVSSDSDNVIIPFSFIKATTLVITFEFPPGAAFLVDRSNGKQEVLIDPSQYGITKKIVPISDVKSLDLLVMMGQVTSNSIFSYFIRHVISNPTGLTYVFVSHDEATINLADETVYDIHNNEVVYDSTAYIDVSMELTMYNESSTYLSTLIMGGTWAPHLDASTIVQSFCSPLDSLFFIKKVITLSRGSDNYALITSVIGLDTQQDIDIASGTDNLFGYHITTSHNDPYLPIPSHWRKTIPVYINTMKVNRGIYGYQLDRIVHDFPSFYLNQPPVSNSINFYFNKPGKNDMENNEYLHNSISIGDSYVHLHGFQDPDIFTEASILLTPDFTIKENGEAVFEQMRAADLPARSFMAAEISSAYTYETMQPEDTIKIEQYAHVNFPDFTTYATDGSIFMSCNADWLNWELAEVFKYDNGGIRQLNGISEYRNNLNSYWGMPLFAAHVFAHNRVQTNLRPFQPGENPLFVENVNPYFIFGDLNSNIRTIQVLSDAHPYTIFGQSGQSAVDYEYHLPTQSSGITYFPSFNLLQVAVDGRAVDVVRPDQTGIIRLIPFDPDSNVTSVKLSLMLASGDEIVCPVTSHGKHEYNASIPDYLPEGFIDIIARTEDNKGNKCELITGPGFYFGATTDNIKLDARLRMTSYALDNVETINIVAGDTLNYNLLYTNYGSDIARDVNVTFPNTTYFRPIGSKSWTIDSLTVNDTIKVAVSLVFLGKQYSTEEYTYYSPSISWSSGGTDYLRSYKVLVDFQNTVTGIVQTESTIPNKFELYQNFPNPFNPSTVIKYDLPKQSRVKLVVYDILGREVVTLVDEMKQAGRYSLTWNANHHASGVYIFRLQAGYYSATKKLLLIK